MQRTKIKYLLEYLDIQNHKEVLEYVKEKAQDGKKKTFIVTVNTEILMIAREDEEYQKVLKSADLALAESIGVIWGGRMLGKNFKERIPGADLIQEICEIIAKEPITVGFLGGKENVVQRTAECLVKKYPGLKVAFAIEEWSGAEVAGKIFETAHAEKVRIGPSSKAANSRFENFTSSPRPNHKSSIINHQSCDILFVAFGSPKQEKWIHENLPKINVRVALGVGGAFDFVSGRVPRAPKLVRSFGLEWLFRLIIQPWRIKRQISLAKFIFLVLKEKFS